MEAGSGKGKKKPGKAKAKKAVDGEASRLAGEIENLKEEIRSTWRKGVDVEGKEFFASDMTALVTGAEPTDRIRLGRGHIKSIEALAWSNVDPDFVVTVGLDGRCLVWHAPSANKVGVTKLKSAWVQTCAFRSVGGNSGIIATAGMDNICSLYTLGEDDMRLIHELKGHEAFISACDFADDSSILTAASDAKTILWDAQKNAQTTLYDFSCGCTSLSLTKNPHNILVGRTDGIVTLCDLTSAKQVTDYECHSDSMSSISMFPNGHAFVTGSDDMTCHLYDLRTGDNLLQEYVVSGKSEGELSSTDFSISGRFLFVGYDDMIRVWDTPKGTVIYNLVTNCKTCALAVNCDGSALCSGGADSDGRIWCIA